MELTIHDIDILIEAVDAWVISSKTTSMLGGLVFGAMLSRGGDVNEGKSFVESMMKGEDEKEQTRKEIAITLKAKLLKMRDQIMIGEVASSI